MDPGRQLRGLAAAEIWRTDPVHPKKEIYGLMADGVIEVERACGSGRSKTRSISGDGLPTVAHPGAAGRTTPQETGYAGREAATEATTLPGGKAAGHAEVAAAASTAGSLADPSTGGGRTGAAGAEGDAGAGLTSGGRA